MLQLFGITESAEEVRNDFLQKMAKCKASMNIDLANKKKENEGSIRQRREDKRIINIGGDFEVQVHIQELRDLVGIDWGESCDPTVTVTIMQQKKSTKNVSKKTNIIMDQILFFSLKALEPRQLLKTKCLIEVFDHNLVFPNKLVGSFEFNLGSIYYKKHHELYNQWVALANHQTLEQNNYDSDSDHKTDDDEEDDHKYTSDRVRSDGIQGSLKVSIFVLGRNDEPYIHSDSDDEEQTNNGRILLPSSITQTPWKLTVRIYKYRYLARLDEDALGFIDRFRHDFDYYNEEDMQLNMTPTQFSNIIRALLPDAISSERREEREQRKQGRLDPFFVVRFGGTPIRSIDYKHIKVCKGCDDDNVYIQFDVPVMEPTYCDHIEIEFHDKDITDSDLIGIIRINYHELKHLSVKPRWYHIYGAPIGHELNKYSKKMNRGYMEGTYFRGQSLIETELTKQQRKTSLDCFRFNESKTKNKKLRYFDEKHHEDYALFCEIYRGTEMYNINEEMYIEVSVGNERECIVITKKQRMEYTIKNKQDEKEMEKEADVETWIINKRLRLLMQDLPRNLEKTNTKDWDDALSKRYIFVYLCVGKPHEDAYERQRIAYHRISICDIFGYNASDSKPKWYDMREDMVLDKYPTNEFPGSLLMGFWCVKNGSSKSKEKVSDLTKTKRQTMHLRADIYFGRNIASTDIYSKCDAYLQIRFCGKTVKTLASDDRTDPQWFQTLFLDDIQVPGDLEFAPAIYCEVFDSNTLKDKAIGRFEQNAAKVWIDGKDKAQDITEYPLKSSENDTEIEGMVMAKFQLTSNKKDLRRHVKIERPPTVPHSVHIIVLGLRDITNILGVHKCCIVFELDGKKYKSRSSNSPLPSNANFCEIIHFDVDLPKDKRFMPNFNISVIDSLFGGLIERTIGHASKNVNDLAMAEETRVEFLKEQTERLSKRIYRDDVDDDDETKTTERTQMIDGENNENTTVIVTVDDESDDDFVYYDENKTEVIPKPKDPKWMSSEDGKLKRVKYDDELEDIYTGEGDYRLKPFLNIPLCSIGKHKRDIGHFKGLISFAEKQSKGLIIDVYEWRNMHKIEKRLQPYIVVKFGKTELTSAWGNVNDEKDDGIFKEIKRRFEIPVIEPAFVDYHDVSITLWNKADGRHKKDKDYKIGYFKYSYVAIKKDKLDGWVSLKHDYKQFEDGVGDILLEMHVESTKLRKARITRIAEPEVTKMRESRSYGQHIVTSEEKGKDDYDIDLGFQYIREITVPQQLYLRLYVLNGINLTPPDGTSKLNDPYLKITIGEQAQTTKSNEMFFKKHILHNNDVSPDFYESFEFAIAMPGPSSLKIECWDITIFGIKNSLIGSTVIDIEDRWYDEYWRDFLVLKPIETRTLKLHNMPKGKLKLWMEILTVDQFKKNPHMIDISQPHKDPYELRLIIWKCSDIPVHDTFESMNDLFCTASFGDASCPQQTDLHFRSEAPWQCNPCSKEGKTTDGSFNWRMKFPVHCLNKSGTQALQIQVWDKDYFSTNDEIGTVLIPLKGFFKYCETKATKNRCIWRENKKQKITKFFSKNGSVPNKIGSITYTLELVPYKLIERYPAGYGRDAPNSNPYLPDPTGRAVLSLWHPMRSIKQLIGKRLCCKLSCTLMFSTIVVGIILFFPQLFTEILVENLFNFRSN